MSSSSVGATTLHGAQATVLVTGEYSAELVESLRRAVVHEDVVGALVRVLSQVALAELPSFGAVVVEPDAIRILVRGSVEVEVVVSADETVVSSAPGVSSWSEHLAPRSSQWAALRSSDEGQTQAAIVLFSDSSSPVSEPRRASPGGDTLLFADEGAEPAAVSEEPAEDSVLTPTSTSASPLVEPLAYDEGDDFDFGHLLDDTRFGVAEEAAIREVEDPPNTALIDGVPPRSTDSGIEPPPPPTPGSGPVGDHDGFTVARGRVRELVAQADNVSSSAPGVAVQAVLCPSGHPNEPVASSCRRCSATIVDRSVIETARPSLGRLVFSDGLVVALDQDLVLGRRPDPTSSVNGGRPVALPDVDRALSRTHAELRLEDWQVLVVDHGSVNGTYVQLPGEPVVKLRAGTAFLVVPGAQVNLGGGASFVYEAT